MNKRIFFAVAGFALLATNVDAQVITGYNITNARASGFGGWSHTYSGTIAAAGGSLYDYTGGGGTLNDGVVSNSAGNNQLFTVGDNSVITLFLNGTYSLSSLSIFGGVFANSIPGTLTGATLGFGGQTAALTSSPFTAGCTSGMCDDLFTFGGTALAGLSGNTITLSNFQSTYFESNFNYYNISELSVSGTPSSVVPEPASLALVAFGLSLTGVVARRRKMSRI